MNVEWMIATSFAIGLGVQFIVVKTAEGAIAIADGVSSLFSENNETLGDVNSSVADINNTTDINATVDANLSAVMEVFNQLSCFS